MIHNIKKRKIQNTTTIINMKRKINQSSFLKMLYFKVNNKIIYKTTKYIGSYLYIILIYLFIFLDFGTDIKHLKI